MNVNDDSNDPIWNDRYSKSIFFHSLMGSIVDIEGVGDRDTYNPSLCDNNGVKTLAFRCENRNSWIEDVKNYHPSILFARQHDNGHWAVADNIAPFDMLEDPLFALVKSSDGDSVVFGGVRAKFTLPGTLMVRTVFYQGTSVETLKRDEPYAMILGMKDERLLQLPDGRLLLCCRPLDNSGIGHVAVYIIDKIDDLKSINEVTPKQILELYGTYGDDWVGINNVYVLRDRHGIEWVGVLGHIGCNDKKGNKHYAATTYKVRLDELLSGSLQPMAMNIIATRACFPDAPRKMASLGDVVFPGSFERLENGKYRLWAGLSDAKIGIIDFDDPFQLD